MTALYMCTLEQSIFFFLFGFFFFFFSVWFSSRNKTIFLFKYAKASFHSHLIHFVISNVLPDTAGRWSHMTACYCIMIHSEAVAAHSTWQNSSVTESLAPAPLSLSANDAAWCKSTETSACCWQDLSRGFAGFIFASPRNFVWALKQPRRQICWVRGRGCIWKCKLHKRLHSSPSCWVMGSCGGLKRHTEVCCLLQRLQACLRLSGPWKVHPECCSNEHPRDICCNAALPCFST